MGFAVPLGIVAAGRRTVRVGSGVRGRRGLRRLSLMLGGGLSRLRGVRLMLSRLLARLLLVRLGRLSAAGGLRLAFGSCLRRLLLMRLHGLGLRGGLGLVLS